MSDVHHDPAARGWLFQLDVQPVHAAFLNKALFVFRACSLEPGEEGAEIRHVWPLWRAPASQLIPYFVCVCACVCVCVCVCEIEIRECACHTLFLNYFAMLPLISFFLTRLTGSMRMLCTLEVH